MRDEVKALMNLKAFILHSSNFIPSILARLRTYPQHTLPLLPLLRSRPGGVHKASVVRSPKSDKDQLQLSIADLGMSISEYNSDLRLAMSE